MSNETGNFDFFCKTLNDTLTLFDELITLENKKVDAIAENDVTQLDQYMNDEQVFLLQMRNLDFKREKTQGQLGVPGLTFRQLTEKFEGAEKETLDSLYEALSSKTAELKEAISGTKKLIEMHLSSISAVLEKIEGNEGVYNKSGEKEPKEPPKRFTPTKA